MNDRLTIIFMMLRALETPIFQVGEERQKSTLVAGKYGTILKLASYEDF